MKNFKKLTKICFLVKLIALFVLLSQFGLSPVAYSADAPVASQFNELTERILFNSMTGCF